MVVSELTQLYICSVQNESEIQLKKQTNTVTLNDPKNSRTKPVKNDFLHDKKTFGIVIA